MLETAFLSYSRPRPCRLSLLLLLLLLFLLSHCQGICHHTLQVFLHPLRFPVVWLNPDCKVTLVHSHESAAVSLFEVHSPVEEVHPPCCGCSHRLHCVALHLMFTVDLHNAVSPIRYDPACSVWVGRTTSWQQTAV